jgi:hypothetical protein
MYPSSAYDLEMHVCCNWGEGTDQVRAVSSLLVYIFWFDIVYEKVFMISINVEADWRCLILLNI